MARLMMMQTLSPLVRELRARFQPFRSLLSLVKSVATVCMAVFIAILFSCSIAVPSAIAAEFTIAPDADLANGAAVFEATCAGCHVNGGNIMRRGKNLKTRALRRNQADTVEAVSAIVVNGKGLMSAYGDRLSANEVRDLASYVLDRANADWK